MNLAGRVVQLALFSHRLKRYWRCSVGLKKLVALALMCISNHNRGRGVLQHMLHTGNTCQWDVPRVRNPVGLRDSRNSHSSNSPPALVLVPPVGATACFLPPPALSPTHLQVSQLVVGVVGKLSRTPTRLAPSPRYFEQFSTT